MSVESDISQIAFYVSFLILFSVLIMLYKCKDLQQTEN